MSRCQHVTSRAQTPRPQHCPHTLPAALGSTPHRQSPWPQAPTAMHRHVTLRLPPKRKIMRVDTGMEAHESSVAVRGEARGGKCTGCKSPQVATRKRRRGRAAHQLLCKGYVGAVRCVAAALCVAAHQHRPHLYATHRLCQMPVRLSKKRAGPRSCRRHTATGRMAEEGRKRTGLRQFRVHAAWHAGLELQQAVAVALG